MLTGPVCHFELVRLARRRRTFVLRFGFGLILFGVVGVNYLALWDPVRSWNDPIPRVLTIQQIATLSRSLFASLMAAQTALVFGLTPALVADAIASERQRKTLHYLLTSRLSGPEIVVGKLAARMISVGVFLFLVLPILSLQTLVGGIDPEELLWCYAALGSSAFFLSGLAILASVFARRPRDAVATAYTLTAVWLFLPTLLTAIMAVSPSTWSRFTPAMAWFFGWVWPASPLSLLINTASIAAGGPSSLRWEVAWLVGSQTAYGVLAVIVAAWQVRPAFRRHEGRGVRRSVLNRQLGRWLSRRHCGEDPIFWKEAYFLRSRGNLVRQVGRLIVPVLQAAVVIAFLCYSPDVFREVRDHGFLSDERASQRARGEFNVSLRITGAMVMGFWLLALAASSAASISSEREQDTWVSLLSTPLEGREILRGKMLGGLRATLGFALTIGSLWLLGLATGAVHPLGFFLALACLAMFVWFAIALGTYLSLHSGTTWRAQAIALGTLILPHFCCILPSPMWILGYSLLSYPEVRSLTTAPISFYEVRWFLALFAAYVLGALAFYLGGAFLMTHAVFRSFDRVVDRPRRPSAGRDVPLKPVAAGSTRPNSDPWPPLDD